MDKWQSQLIVSSLIFFTVISIFSINFYHYAHQFNHILANYFPFHPVEQVDDLIKNNLRINLFNPVEIRKKEPITNDNLLVLHDNSLDAILPIMQKQNEVFALPNTDGNNRVLNLAEIISTKISNNFTALSMELYEKSRWVIIDGMVFRYSFTPAQIIQALSEWKTFNLTLQELLQGEDDDIIFERLDLTQHITQIVGKGSQSKQLILINSKGAYLGPKIEDKTENNANQPNSTSATNQKEVDEKNMISANFRKTKVASQEKYIIDLDGDGIVNYGLEEDTTASKNITKNQKITTNNAQDKEDKVSVTPNTAGQIINRTISMKGVSEAKSVEVKKGKIILVGDEKRPERKRLTNEQILQQLVAIKNSKKNPLAIKAPLVEFKEPTIWFDLKTPKSEIFAMDKLPVIY